MGKAIGMVKGREQGTDVHVFKKLMPNARWVKPEELFLNAHGQLCDTEGPLEQVSLELRQAEVAALSPDVQIALCRMESQLLNDLRTILIVHDKRLLSVMSDKDLVCDFLEGNHDDAVFLSDRIPTTLVVEALDESKLASVLEAKDDWLLKPSLAGKGHGIVLGRCCTVDEWRNVVTDPAHGHFVLQQAVKQHQFQIETPGGSTLAHVVGVTLNCGSHFFGPGACRAAPLEEEIVNVAGGRAFVLPTVERTPPLF